MLNAEETRTLLDSIPTERVIGIGDNGEEIKAPDLVGLRGRALIGAMFFTFARRCRGRDDGRGLLHARKTLLAATARERREGMEVSE